MAKWRGTATVVWYLDAPDRKSADALFEAVLDAVEPAGYRDSEIEEVDEDEYRRHMGGK